MENTSQISLQDYWLRLKNLRSELRDRIAQELGFTTKTFYTRMMEDNWTPAEQSAIQKVIREFNGEIVNLTEND